VRALALSCARGLHASCASLAPEPAQPALRTAQAKLRGIPQSPDKVNAVASVVRRRLVHEALNQLALSRKRAACWLSKTIRSAAANAAHSKGMHDVSPDALRVEQAFVGRGPQLKRIDIKGKGSRGIRRRRRCHLTVVVSDRPPSLPQPQRTRGGPVSASPRPRGARHNQQRWRTARPRDRRPDGWEVQKPRSTPFERHRHSRLRRRGMLSEQQQSNSDVETQ
jgi:large subunit ribosomal protein L22